jgi:hypothetical protein
VNDEFESKIELSVKISWIQILVKRKKRGRRRGRDEISYGKMCEAASAGACPE